MREHPRGKLPKLDDVVLIPGWYRMDMLQVHITGDTKAILSCNRILAENYREVVTVGWFERLRGVTLEQKLTKRVMEAREMMQTHNEKLKQRRDLEKKINATLGQ
ncbi:hypothetical protein WJ0W_003270 [Paenibacillus melissococcoides]|uniref:Uncharacterized protein n=1 Tax=Paenibacillus melissococcoides TaxID=2912268 RepID=A0ABN8U4M8_9BACL|nr:MULTISPECIES: hypothetical protein [Paenibacillus]MEB9893294.1 hypothetical protein [Bacillus cereus]CAH8246033.1 hypothetical protein WJ0W_003270 [Paenibacillus melissococcoides]CAH8712773.1 hypothetical protein WDD9_003349 [Paenibacillus melissococcoides]CAH8713543.1 hypothetical protein HTL2_003652 [Paenibacillus melissococcoides]GIO78773.1 hypothetical protein J6TS7_23830 [Paenibacillus dendritiformis]